MTALRRLWGRLKAAAMQLLPLVLDDLHAFRLSVPGWPASPVQNLPGRKFCADSKGLRLETILDMLVRTQHCSCRRVCTMIESTARADPVVADVCYLHDM